MSRNSAPGFRRQPRIADHMTADLMACVVRSAAAERAGDAVLALEWHQAVPMFGRGRHRQVMTRLARLDGELPPWVWARWVVYQAIRCEDPGSRTGELHRQVLQHTMEMFHGDRLRDCYEDAGDPIQVAALLVGESWIFHQLFTYEFGGLASFLEEFVASPLAEHAEVAKTWLGAEMRGWRVAESLPGSRLRVLDLASSSWIEVLDLGARSSAGPDGWVLGRLVPSGIDDLLMFDAPPLAVSERIAREVTVAQSGTWSPLVDALHEGRLAPDRLLREDYELTTDVQELDMLRYGTRPQDLERVTLQLRDGRDEIARAAYRILQQALDGTVPDSDAAYVAAAVLNPTADAEARSRLLRGGQYDVWLRWAGLVPEPARRLLLDFAHLSRAAG